MVKLGKKKIYGIGIVLAVVVIGLSVKIYDVVNVTDDEFIAKAINHKTVNGKEYAQKMLNDRYGYGDSSEKTAIHNIVFEEEIKKQKEWEEKNKVDKLLKDAETLSNNMKKVTVGNLTSQNTFGDFYDITFDIVNGSDKYITYIEFILEAYDSNGKVLESSWCNESNILANATHNKSYHMRIPQGSENWGVKVKDIKWGY